MMAWILIVLGLILAVLGFIGKWRYNKQSIQPISDELSFKKPGKKAQPKVENESFKSGTRISQENKFKPVNNLTDNLLDDSFNSNPSKQNSPADINDKISIDQFSSQRDKLVRVNQEMDRLIQLIAEKEKQIDRALANIGQSSEKKGNKNGSFRDVFTEIYQQKEEGTIPEKYQHVLKLHQEGREAIEIARSLNLGVRETTLILKLYRKEEELIVW